VAVVTILVGVIIYLLCKSGKSKKGFEEDSYSVSKSSSVVYANPEDVRVGQKTLWRGKIGIIRFVGRTHFQPGEWVGVEFDEPGNALTIARC
jgi:hypothetical protein